MLCEEGARQHPAWEGGGGLHSALSQPDVDSGAHDRSCSVPSARALPLLLDLTL